MKKLEGTPTSHSYNLPQELIDELHTWIVEFANLVEDDTKRKIVGLPNPIRFDPAVGILYAHPMEEELYRLLKKWIK